MNTQTTPQASQSLLLSMSRDAEANWGDFVTSHNGRAIVESSEMSAEERVKTAFICGNIMGQTSAVAAFVQEGMNQHLLPHRRIVWKSPEQLLAKLSPGQQLSSIVFLVHHENDDKGLYQGWVYCTEAHPELTDLPETERLPHLLFRTDLGGSVRTIQNVVAWVELDTLLRTFFH